MTKMSGCGRWGLVAFIAIIFGKNRNGPQATSDESTDTANDFGRPFIKSWVMITNML